MKYLVLRVDGSKETVDRPAPLELKELQNLVGGYIEYVHIPETTFSLIVNEEGRLKQLSPNPFVRTLVGNVVLGKIEGSEFMGLTDKEFTQLKFPARAITAANDSSV